MDKSIRPKSRLLFTLLFVCLRKTTLLIGSLIGICFIPFIFGWNKLPVVHLQKKEEKEFAGNEDATRPR